MYVRENYTYEYRMHVYVKAKLCILSYVARFKMSRTAQVSIVSGYGLDDRVIEVRSPAEAKGFFL
jgi:hypothetical protein